MLTILNALNPASSHPVQTTSEKIESVTTPKAAKRLSNGAVKTRKKLDDPVSVTETDSEEEETATHGEKQEAKLDEGSVDSAVTSTREVLRFTYV
jgi:hypothetical protein